MTYLFLAIALIAAFIVLLYNGLVKLRNKCHEAWADIDTQLKRRQDLIPNLVETVKGYSTHEASTLENVVKARTEAINAQTIEEKGKAENLLSDTLKSIFALSENYPDLKANQNFLDLQKNLSEIEGELQMARRYYNGTVREFNTKLEVFPNNLLIKLFKFTHHQFFQATDEEKENVKIDFNTDKKDETVAPEAPAAMPEAPAATPEAPAATPTQMPETPVPMPATPVQMPEVPTQTPGAAPESQQQTPPQA